MIGYITNQHDRDNLNFLLNSSEEVLADWHKQTDEDDKVYAQELLEAYARELKLDAQNLRIEAEMMRFDNYPDASRVIARVVDSLSK